MIAGSGFAAPVNTGDAPRHALQQAYALREQPEHRFDALQLALSVRQRFHQLQDGDGEAEADYLIGVLLEDRALAAWYQSQLPAARVGLDPALDFLVRADALFQKSGDWVGGVKTAYEIGNVQTLLGDAVQACGFYRESLSRYDAGRAAQSGVEITLLGPDRRDFREVLLASVRRACD